MNLNESFCENELIIQQKNLQKASLSYKLICAATLIQPPEEPRTNTTHKYIHTHLPSLAAGLLYLKYIFAKTSLEVRDWETFCNDLMTQGRES